MNFIQFGWWEHGLILASNSTVCTGKIVRIFRDWAFFSSYFFHCPGACQRLNMHWQAPSDFWQFVFFSLPRAPANALIYGRYIEGVRALARAQISYLVPHFTNLTKNTLKKTFHWFSLKFLQPSIMNEATIKISYNLVDGTWFNPRLKSDLLLWVVKNIYRHWQEPRSFGFWAIGLFFPSFFHCPRRLPAP